MIAVTNLVKRYGGFTAVDNVSFTAEPGRVTGFLGPNGAGKSTAMRTITGLTKPTSGAALVLGKRYQDLVNPARHVGTLLDASAQHAGRTGSEVLKLGAITLGLPSSRADQMLDLVGLSKKEGKRRIRNYSLGMRQRLGIAHAFLGDPQVLILDEPVNGLDPAGIRWMRDLLASYASEGGTVLLSSHLLSEIQRIADDLVVIGRGKIVAEGSLESMLRRAGSHVKSTNDTELAARLDAAGLGPRPAQAGGIDVDAEPTKVGEVALQAGIALVELRPAGGGDLEDMFLNLTADDAREGVAA